MGLLEGIGRGVNWKLFAKQFMSWVATLFVVGLTVAAVFAQVGRQVHNRIKCIIEGIVQPLLPLFANYIKWCLLVS